MNVHTAIYYVSVSYLYLAKNSPVLLTSFENLAKQEYNVHIYILTYTIFWLLMYIHTLEHVHDSFNN